MLDCVPECLFIVYCVVRHNILCVIHGNYVGSVVRPRLYCSAKNFMENQKDGSVLCVESFIFIFQVYANNIVARLKVNMGSVNSPINSN